MDVRRAYSLLSESFDAVEVGRRNDRWILGANTDRGGIRIIFSGQGEMTSFQAVHNGRDISRAANGNLNRAVTLLRQP